MTPQEWWWIYDAKVGEPSVNGIPESELEEAYQIMKRGGFK